MKKGKTAATNIIDLPGPKPCNRRFLKCVKEAYLAMVDRDDLVTERVEFDSDFVVRLNRFARQIRKKTGGTLHFARSVAISALLRYWIKYHLPTKGGK